MDFLNGFNFLDLAPEKVVRDILRDNGGGLLIVRNKVCFADDLDITGDSLANAARASEEVA